MTRIELFELWAPPASPWSRWAKPILFADPVGGPSLAPPDEPWPEFDAPVDSHTALVVDVPGEEAVRVGLGLARKGCRPVPLYNSAPGPISSASPATAVVVDTEAIRAWLVRGALVLRNCGLSANAPPAFLLDANRQGASRRPLPGQFDNRWLVFPQDFPSARFLLLHGIRRVLLIQEKRIWGDQPSTDLAHVLLRWQEGGLEVCRCGEQPGMDPQPLRVRRPTHFRTLWQHALAILGLRRNSAGGFGSVVPQPSGG